MGERTTCQRISRKGTKLLHDTSEKQYIMRCLDCLSVPWEWVHDISVVENIAQFWETIWHFFDLKWSQKRKMRAGGTQLADS